METKFTKGNWESIIIDISDYGISAVVSDEEVICHCNISGNKLIDEVNANTKLISAAPEMFEALQLFTENVEHWLNSGIAADKETSEMIYNKAKSAIKKATK